MVSDLEKSNKLKDISNIVFGNNPTEIVASMEILVMLIDVDDDKEVIAACKERLSEGVTLLKQMKYENLENFNV